jgi:hypothetical protein
MVSLDSRSINQVLGLGREFAALAARVFVAGGCLLRPKQLSSQMF